MLRLRPRSDYGRCFTLTKEGRRALLAPPWLGSNCMYFPVRRCGGGFRIRTFRSVRSRFLALMLFLLFFRLFLGLFLDARKLPKRLGAVFRAARLPAKLHLEKLLENLVELRPARDAQRAQFRRREEPAASGATFAYSF